MEKLRGRAVRAGWSVLLVAAVLAPPAHAQADVVQPDAAAATAEVPFDVFEFRVLGNTVLPAREVEAAVYPLLGQGKRIADVERARDSLVEAYRKAGFGTVLVDIPEQSVDDGIVRLQVTEGRIGRVEVKGAEYFSNRELKDMLPSIAPGTVPSLPQLQAELAGVARASTDRRVTPVLRAGRQPGEVDLVLNVDDQSPFHADFEVNDRSTADTSRTRASATLSYDYLFGQPQSVSLQYQTAPEAPDEVKVLALTWVRRLPESGRVWAAYAIDSKSDIAAVGTLNVLGDGRIVGFRHIIPAVSTATHGFGVTLGADYKDFRENIFLEDDESSVTPLSYMVSTLGTSGYLRKGAWAVDGSLNLVLGVRGLFNGEQEFAFKRAFAHGSFAYLKGEGAVSYTLPHNFLIGLRWSAQYSGTPLVSNEQFSIGGLDTVRGYLEAEALVDRGVAGGLELAAPPLQLFSLGDQPYTLRAALFLDAGVGSLERPLPSQTSRVDLSSYGLGFSVSGGRALDARLDWARTLVPGSRTNAEESRVHFVFKMGF